MINFSTKKDDNLAVIYQLLPRLRSLPDEEPLSSPPLLLRDENNELVPLRERESLPFEDDELR
ncbi:MAG: hypothetical protein U5J63_09645 [Fodinibius sp.]|nr:hypothetical protein [Fodinibius sp.]